MKGIDYRYQAWLEFAEEHETTIAKVIATLIDIKVLRRFFTYAEMEEFLNSYQKEN